MRSFTKVKRKSYLVQTFLYHRFVRFPAGGDELGPLVPHHIQVLLEPIDVILEALQR